MLEWRCHKEISGLSLLWKHSLRQFRRVSIFFQLPGSFHGNSSGDHGVMDGRGHIPCLQRGVQLQTPESLRLAWLCEKLWTPVHPSWCNNSLCLLWMQSHSRRQGQRLSLFSLKKEDHPYAQRTVYDLFGFKWLPKLLQEGVLPHICWKVMLWQELWFSDCPKFEFSELTCIFPFSVGPGISGGQHYT